MFAVVRTGGKQYRVAADDQIVVEKLEGDAGSKIELGDVLLVSVDGALKDAAKVKVTAEIVGHNRGDKVIIFKKKRRHNYRRKNGHRQHQTVLKILSIA
jgi:large subunit ribosomal protein L21